MVEQLTTEQLEYITRSLYVPARAKFARGVDPERCRHVVLSPWNRTGAGVQCSRRAYVLIGDYGFCQQHAHRLLDHILESGAAAD